MRTRIFANRFGLVALLTASLIPSTPAFSATQATAQQVVVTNTTAQSIPMVGLVKDMDSPGRTPFRTTILQFNVPASNGVLDGTGSKFLTSVPSGMRLVIEHVSGRCLASPGVALLQTTAAGSNSITASEYLPGDIFSKFVSVPLKFYADQGEYVYLNASNSGFSGGNCYMTVTGYYIALAGF